MASWNGGTGDGGNRPGGSTQRTVPTPDYQSQDSEENVIEETEDVFTTYLYHRWQKDQDRQGFISTPTIPQMSGRRDPMSTSCQVGRELARIGDIINQRHQNEFDSMINNLNIDSVSAYNTFSRVANKLLEEDVNWGRILALFSFGYRIIVKVLGFDSIADFGSAIKKVVRNMVKFVTDTTKGIVQWIARQGGWMAYMKDPPPGSGKAFAAVSALAVLAIATVWYIHKSN